jgi:hypothetical protein
MPKLSEIIVNLQERPPIAIAASLETLDGCRMRDEWIVPDGVIVFVLSNPSRFGLEKGSFIQADSIQAFLVMVTIDYGEEVVPTLWDIDKATVWVLAENLLKQYPNLTVPDLVKLALPARLRRLWVEFRKSTPGGK